MRLIDADALLNKLPFHPDGGLRSFKDLGIISRVRLTIEDMPIIDAVPVVRCKDCKHYGVDKCICRSTGDPYYDWNPAPEWFCSDGERIEKKAISESLRQYVRDAVPVIRCTECKYYGPSEYAGFWHCENWGVESNMTTAKPETFYCADAERKES